MMMNVQRYSWLMAVALMGMLAGCLGGSGSSGFDITENVAIQEAIDTQECQEFEGLVICPAEPRSPGVPSPTPTPTRTPPAASMTPPVLDTPTHNGTPAQETVTPTSVPTATETQRAVETRTPVPSPSQPVPMQIQTSVNASSDIVCAGGGDVCSFAFFFVASGFPPDAIYRTAYRESPEQPWTLSQPTEANDSDPNQASFGDVVQVAPPASAPSGSEATVQLAVLVFLTDPGALPPTVMLLADTGADFAYVLPAVPVSSITP
jgi:hypothetical protein